VPDGVTDEEALMLADVLPTGYEVGVLAGGVRPGDVVAVVGAGPVGLAAMTAAQLFSPSHVVAIDLSDARLDAARQFGADIVVNNAREDPLAIIKDLTDRLGADVSIEAVGSPATFELAVKLARPGGRRPAVHHSRFGLDEFEEAYEVAALAADTGALAVDLESAILAALPWPGPFAVVRAVVDRPEAELLSHTTVTGGIAALRSLRRAAPVIAAWAGALHPRPLSTIPGPH
nr:zinc-binding dehydrogenase [Actinomycetota bacterium]